MPAPIVLTAEEWIERMNDAAPPTADDVSILWDGRRLDSREAVMAWLADIEAKRLYATNWGERPRIVVAG